ncbi:PilW family protein [Aerosakkonema sp. BLCC-F183]|uniref:PilW family protein n=1 Tax=Aerosakkonema sp. BLCC-F183 TaxID=3342834 RepID=UPI0035BB789C
MSTKIIKSLLKRTLFKAKKGKKAGFTILELLVAIVISTFVILALLDMITDLLQSERREYGRSETQREMQMAMDFIVNDLREAAYVYTNEQINNQRTIGGIGITSLRANLPFNTKYEPILVFWKPEQINGTSVNINDTSLNSLNCDNFGSANADPVNPKRQECDQLKIRRRAYSLVVYLQVRNSDDNPDNNRWKGISRIMRYQLYKYPQNKPDSNLTKSDGYTDPTENSVSFASWPFDSRGVKISSGNINTSSTAVLVDFLDYPDRTSPGADPRDNLTVKPSECPTETYVDSTGNRREIYNRIPPSTNPNGFTNPSFMACVRSAINVSGDVSNQDIVLFLRGNPTGKGGIKVAPLLAIKTQAVARGVIDKKPAQ